MDREEAPALVAGSIDLNSVRIDGGTQIRVKIDTATVTAYADAAKNGAVFPPMTVFHDGATYWLGDGFHRHHAARRNKAKKIRAEIHTGTQRDAILHAIQANATHGLPRSNADKRKAVTTLLRDEEWSQKSNRWIAQQAKVDDKTVGKYRNEMEAKAKPSGAEVPHLNADPKPESPKSAPEPNDDDIPIEQKKPTRQGKDGKSYPAPDKPAAETAEEPFIAPAPDPDSMEAAVAALNEYRKALRDARTIARRVFKIEKKIVKAPWLNRFSYECVIGTLNEVLRETDDLEPVGGTADKPLTARQRKALKALRESPGRSSV